MQEPVITEGSSVYAQNRTGPIIEAAPDLGYGLSPSECHERFPDLFVEIRRAVSLRNDQETISAYDLDLSWKKSGALRAMIYNQKLYVIEVKFDGQGYDRTRLLGILHQLNRAIQSSPFLIPNIEFSIAVGDRPDELHDNHTIWAYSRHSTLEPNIWTVPNFGFWSWPLDLVGEYGDIRSEMRNNEVGWEKKIPKAFWRGAIKTNQEIRGALMNATTGKEWADVAEVTWKSRLHVSDASNALPIAEHCKYQFLVHTEGRSYSGRGKYLLNCGSITVTHKPEWIEPHTHIFTSSGPQQNILEAQRDFSDLEAKLEELRQDPSRAKEIVANSVATFRNRYLTPAAETCYWRQLFLSWADASLTPSPWEVDQNGKE